MKKLAIPLITLSLATIANAASLNSINDMRQSFITPPDSTRTKVWWFHGEDSVTHEGITADLEAYRQQGIGGIVYYDQVHGKGENAPKLMSRQWWDALLFSAKEAKRLGLSFEANVGNGYVAGGPWITPELSMKRVASSEIEVNGGINIDTILPSPEFSYFSDIAVLAIPADNHRSVTLLSDSTIRSSSPSDTIIIDYDCGENFTARSLTYTLNGRAKAKTLAMNYPGKPGEEFYGCLYRTLPSPGTLEVSDDGINYRTVAAIEPRYRNHGGVKFKTISFPAVTGRYYRIKLHDWGSGHKDDNRISIENVTLHQDALNHGWETKAALVSEYVDDDLTPAYGKEEIITRDRIINLSACMGKDGKLKSSPLPPGKWNIIRFYAVSTGARTKHGRKEALGLECDKLSAAGAECQWKNYVKPVVDSLRTHGAIIEGITMDSHEAGPQNWTQGLDKDFLSRNGYDMIAFLPAMTGYVVDSPEATTAFLHDLRRTLSQLTAERYYGAFNSLARKEGLRFTAQAIGGALCLSGDNIEVKKHIDKPQGEFWAYQTDGSYDIKDCSSAAHIYGKRIASGEAFTDAKYSHKPHDIKSLADYACAFGINEFVICASAYQPSLTDIPGNTANGRQYCLNRNNTFWELSKPMWDSQARCNYMLRQGEPIVDLGVYLGDDVPIRIISHRLPEIPEGFNFDAFTTDALMSMAVDNSGMITLPSGMKFSAITLPDTEFSQPIRNKIAELKKAGARVYEPAANESLATFLQSSRIMPDFTYPSGDTMFFAHRRLPDADIYFIVNHQNKPVDFASTFNTSGKNAEIWNHVTGEIKGVATSATTDGRQSLYLSLAPHESTFVIFHDHTTGLPAYTHEAVDSVTITGEWKAWFDPKMGGVGNVALPRLSDYTLSDNPAIKYFSGTATFANSFNASPDAKSRYELKLDGFTDVAEVIINNQSAGHIWCSPWTLDITPYITSGNNEITLRVANSLYNRMIGDLNVPADRRVTKASTPIVDESTPLVPSGINGNVTIIRYTD
ncbi:MAG: glycosyl hydrolase family 2 [Bacteroides sp.]|nr:glycosyl hydrolase family 2 [Bacteroides sp.]MCM1389955.1 glycosyl hydrolase family 2 [Bacteroides sp.]